jgi:hypothetical protein
MSDIHLAQRMSGHRAQDSGLSPNLFRLPLESARQKAREIIASSTGFPNRILCSASAGRQIGTPRLDGAPAPRF